MPHDGHHHRLDGLIPAGGPENPHELLGLNPDEDDLIKIIEAAKLRLAFLRESRGSEIALKQAVAREIMAARAAMLARARSADRRHRGTSDGSDDAILACAGSQNSGGD